MGAFFGSIHLRTTDFDFIQSTIDEIAREKNRKFYVAPTCNGWITAYPSKNGQEITLAKSIAQSVPCDVLHLIDHDDSAFYYGLYRDRKAIDQFVSNPNFLDGENPDNLRGNVAEFATFFEAPERDKRVARLRKILSTADKYLFATDVLREFAKVLNIPNALTAYEYLKQGETEGVKNWKRFIHVPEIFKDATTQLWKVEEKRLLKEKVLLFQHVSRGKNACFPQVHSFTTYQSGILMWSGNPIAAVPSTSSLVRLSSPWVKVESLGIELPGAVQNLNVNVADERWICVDAIDSLQIWDLVGKHQHVKLSHQRERILWSTFSKDGTRLYYQKGQHVHEINLASIEQKELFEFEALAGQRAFLHPDGDHLLLHCHDRMSLLSLSQKRALKRLYVGQILDLTKPYSRMAEKVKEQASKESIDAAPAKFDSEIKKLPATIKTKMPKANENRKALEAFAEEFVKVMTSRDAAISGSERANIIKFSADGRFVFCGTDLGLHVYRWQDVMSEETQPKPIYSFKLSRIIRDVPVFNFTYDICEDQQRRCVLFCSLDGKIRYLNFESGQQGELLAPPGENQAICQLELSPNGSALFCRMMRDLDNKRKGLTSVLQVWDYNAVWKNAVNGSVSTLAKSC